MPFRIYLWPYQYLTTARDLPGYYNRSFDVRIEKKLILLIAPEQTENKP
jgi:hypothetical protein